MKTLNIDEAQPKLPGLLEEAAASHEPILITGGPANAVLISEDDWRALQETLYLLSVPGMRESVRDGLATPVEACATELDW